MSTHLEKHAVPFAEAPSTGRQHGCCVCAGDKELFVTCTHTFNKATTVLASCHATKFDRALCELVDSLLKISKSPEPENDLQLVTTHAEASKACIISANDAGVHLLGNEDDVRAWVACASAASLHRARAKHAACTSHSRGRAA